jgi:hypothetical protein
MVIAVTVMVAQLYEQLDEFSHSLLLLRLGETGIGAGVAVATTLLVLPLRTTRVVEVAASELLGAVRRLVVDALDSLRGAVRRVHLEDQARAVDSAFQALEATVRPLRHLGETGRRAQRLAIAAGALRHYSRNLAGDVPDAPCGGLELGADAEAGIRRGRELLLASLDALTAVIGGPGASLPPADPLPAAPPPVPLPVYVRSASAWNVVEQESLDALRRAVNAGEGLGGNTAAVMLVARDLQLLDGALAELAGLRGIPVEGLDVEGRRS